MNRILLILSFILLVPSLTKAESSDTTIKKGHFLEEAISFKNLLNAESKPQLVDVRTSGEYEKGFIEGADNVNVNDASFLQNMNKYDTSKTVYVYCLSGGRSRMASRRLMRAGFRHVIELKGGIMSWNSKGFPVVVKKANSTELTMSDFKKMLVSDRKVLIVFSASWCGPCIKMKPMINRFELDHEDSLKVIRIDVDDNATLTDQLGVESIPYLMMYEDLERQWSHVGFMTEPELLKKFRSK